MKIITDKYIQLNNNLLCKSKNYKSFTSSCSCSNQISFKQNQPFFGKQANGNENIPNKIFTKKLTSNDGQIHEFDYYINTKPPGYNQYIAREKDSHQTFYVNKFRNAKFKSVCTELYQAFGINTIENKLYTDTETGDYINLNNYSKSILRFYTSSGCKPLDSLGLDILLGNRKNIYKYPLFDDKKYIVCDYFTERKSVIDFPIPEEINLLADNISKYIKRFSVLNKKNSINDLINTLKKTADADDNIIINILKNNDCEEYIEPILKRKQFMKDFVNTYETKFLYPYLSNIKQTPEEIIYNVYFSTLDLYVQKAQTYEDLRYIQNAVLNTDIENTKISRHRIELLESINKKAQTINNFYPAGKEKETQEIRDFLSDAEKKSYITIDEKTGSIEYNLSDYEINMYEKTYSKNISSSILDVLSKPLYFTDEENLIKLYNANNGKYKNFWQNNFCEFFIAYNKLKSSKVIFQAESELNEGKWDIILTPIIRKITPQECEILNDYKGSESDYNYDLTLLENNDNYSVSPVKKKKIDILTRCLEKYELNQDVTVYRGDEIDVLSKLRIDDKNIQDILNDINFAPESSKVNKLIEAITDSEIEFKNERFMSSSLFKDCYKYTMFEKCPVKWEIKVKKGTKALFAETNNIENQYTEECELLIQRGNNCKINEINFDYEKGEWLIKAVIERTDSPPARLKIQVS